MTHGIGSIGGGGGGGGGGFSGGFTFSAVTAHHATNSRRRRNGNSGNNDDDCCCALCYLVAFLLCMVSMKRRTRLILIWFYVIVGAIVTGVLIGKHLKNTSFSVSPSDMRKIDTVSSILCDKVTTDATSKISTYVFKEEPEITVSPVSTYVVEKTAVLDRNDYEYWGFYLLERSSIEISFCGDYGVYLYIIIGDDNFNKWTDNYQCDDCYETRLELVSCVLRSSHSVFASTSDQYYFVFLNDDIYISPAKIANAEFAVSRTRYITAPAQLLCYNEMDCVVPISLIHPDKIVVDIPDTMSFDSEVNVICTSPRIYMYIILFGVCPVFIGILATLVTLKCYRKKTTRQRSPSEIFIINANDQLHGVANESYNATRSSSAAPPIYAKSPPSYAEATKSSA